MLPSIRKLMEKNDFIRQIDGPPEHHQTLRSTSLPDLMRERDILLADGWTEDGAMRFGNVDLIPTFWQTMKKD